MARGMHKPKSLDKRQGWFETGNPNSNKTQMHMPGSNKK